MEDFIVVWEVGSVKEYDSIVFDLVTVAVTFNVLNEVITMERQGHLWPKDICREKTGKRAWEMEVWYLRCK